MVEPDERAASHAAIANGPVTSVSIATRARRAGPALVAFLVGVALSVAVFVVVRARARQQSVVEFERRGVQLSTAVRARFEVPLEVLHSIRALFDASTGVTRSEFAAFVRGAVARHPSVYALEWIPRVEAKDRAAYEAAARADGFAGFQFTEEDGTALRRAGERPWYLPLYYMEPPNLVALGFDEAAEPARRVMAARACDEATAIVSARLRLVQDDPSIVSVIVFEPVFRHGAAITTIDQRREALLGYAGVVFRIASVLEGVGNDAMLDGYDVALFDDDATGDRVMYSSAGASIPRDDDPLRWSTAFPFAGRSWTLVLTERPWRTAARARDGWTTLGAGLVLSILAGLAAWAITTILRLRGQVDVARQLGQYTLVEKIGEGGMGVVYRAHHAMLRRPTAIKLIQAGAGAALAERVARFEREVQLTSRLTHPNTIAVYDYGCSPNGTLYYAMEYLDGITLEELVELDGPQPAARVIHLLRQACGALGEAHSIGLIHRDVKPANLMLCTRGGVPDVVKVLDFGLAKETARDDAALSQVAAILGTPLYLSPEAITRADTIDGRADVYALGAVAYFLLTGSPPFLGSTVLEVCAMHLHAAPTSFRDRVPPVPVPEALEAAVSQCLSKVRDARPSAAELLRVLDELAREHPWTALDAAAWWEAHGETVVRAQRARRSSVPGAGPRTLAIDVLARAPTDRVSLSRP